MKHTPMCVHRLFTNGKIHKLREYLMTQEDLEKCEKDPQIRPEVVERYKKKYPAAAKTLAKKMDDVFKNNPRVGTGAQRERIKQDMEFCWFGYGFHPDEYMFYDLAGENQSIDKRRAFVSEQERVAFRFSVNDFTEWILSDKAEVYKHFSKYYKRDAVCIDRHTDYADYERFLQKHPSFVQKYVSSSRGAAVQLKNVEKIGDIKQYFKQLRAEGKFLLEEKIEQSDYLNAVSKSINNIRVSTFYTKDGIEPICGFFTLGKGSTFVVNATIGCVFSTIDVKTGRICSDGVDEFGNRYKVHPDSGITINGFQLPEWDEAIKICTEIARQMPKIKYVSFDLAHTNAGGVGLLLKSIHPGSSLIRPVHWTALSRS